MFRDLARMTAQLKGPRYEGALIGRAIWERQLGDRQGGLCVRRDEHRLVEVTAADASGCLTLVMLLGHAAPVPESPSSSEAANVHRLRLLVTGVAEPAVIFLRFSAAEIHDFVRSVGDTNPLHEGPHPVVPGLAILEAALAHPVLAHAVRAELRFRGASFAGEALEVEIRPAVLRQKG